MKEATGELNMTVVTVVAIAAVAAFFYAFVWPAIKNNINRQTMCASAYNCTDDTRKSCTVVDEKGKEIKNFDCSGANTGSTSGN